MEAGGNETGILTSSKFFAKQDAADVREWGEALKRLGYLKQ